MTLRCRNWRSTAESLSSVIDSALLSSCQSLNPVIHGSAFILNEDSFEQPLSFIMAEKKKGGVTKFKSFVTPPLSATFITVSIKLMNFKHLC